MITKRRASFILLGLLLVIQVVFAGPVAAEEATVNTQTVERLERLIREQQQQLESLQEQLNQLKQTAAEAQNQAKEAKTVAEEAKTTAQAPGDKTVTSGQERVKLAVSGQVNRAVNIVDDGKDTQAYFVDNDASNTRVRFIGTAKATDDLTIGSRIADIAGGMLFRQKSDDSLTDVSVSDAFKDFDGLSRKNRVRYDTPAFGRFDGQRSAL
jgi:TolA-binding protein